MKRLLTVTVCGVTLGLLPYIADLVHSRLSPGFLEYFWMPGLLLASLAYPEGVHTGKGAPIFLPLSVALNVFVYCGVTWLVMRMYSGMTSRRLPTKKPK
jgi:hypothetical protein